MSGFVIPVPPLELGVGWTGESLLRWVTAALDRDGQRELQRLFVRIGPEEFAMAFARKADEMNERVSARVIDPRTAPEDAKRTELN